MELDDGVEWTGIWESPWPGADPGFVRPEAYTILGVLFEKKNKILGTNVNISRALLEPLSGPWKGPMQATGPEV
jgi:hypothetical protein